MLDHAFLEVVGILRESFAAALLDRHNLEERFQMDVLLGDISWESSYSLPGEPSPARVRADLSLDWPTWSQTAYRAWTIGEPPDEPPEIGVELVLRIQGLAGRPDVAVVAAALAAEGPALGLEPLLRSAPTVEQTFEADLSGGGWAVEFAYEGTYELTVDALDRRNLLGPDLQGFGAWVASTLVRLGDLHLEFLPEEADGDL